MLHHAGAPCDLQQSHSSHHLSSLDVASARPACHRSQDDGPEGEPPDREAFDWWLQAHLLRQRRAVLLLLERQQADLLARWHEELQRERKRGASFAGLASTLNSLAEFAGLHEARAAEAKEPAASEGAGGVELWREAPGAKSRGASPERKALEAQAELDRQRQRLDYELERLRERELSVVRSPRSPRSPRSQASPREPGRAWRRSSPGAESCPSADSHSTLGCCSDVDQGRMSASKGEATLRSLVASVHHEIENGTAAPPAAGTEQLPRALVRKSLVSGTPKPELAVAVRGAPKPELTDRRQSSKDCSETSASMLQLWVEDGFRHQRHAMKDLFSKQLQFLMDHFEDVLAQKPTESRARPSRPSESSKVSVSSVAVELLSPMGSEERQSRPRRRVSTAPAQRRAPTPPSPGSPMMSEHPVSEPHSPVGTGRAVRRGRDVGAPQRKGARLSSAAFMTADSQLSSDRDLGSESSEEWVPTKKTTGKTKKDDKEEEQDLYVNLFLPPETADEPAWMVTLDVAVGLLVFLNTLCMFVQSMYSGEKTSEVLKGQGVDKERWNSVDTARPVALLRSV